MIVYVETNFVLEVALRQADYAPCNEIVELSRRGSISLVVPAFSLAEPFEALKRDHQRRSELQQRLKSELRELSRSQSYQPRAAAIAEVTSLLVESQEQEKAQLDVTLKDVIALARVLPVTSRTLTSSFAFQAKYDLSPQDAIVYASVRAHLKSAPKGTKCFVTKDTDFDDPDLRTDLKAFDCKMLTRFRDGLQFITSQIRNPP